MRRSAPIFALLLLALAVTPAPAQKPASRGLDIYFIDVQGGAATLLITPEKESILIDSGWPGFDDRDPKRIVHVLRDLAGCERLDHLVTTHWHIDHYGGVAGIAKLVPIGRFWDRGLPDDGIAGLDFPDGPKPDDPLYLAYKQASNGKRTVLKPGDTLPLKGDLDAFVLAAGGHVFPIPAGVRVRPNEACDDEILDKPRDDSDNARSLSLIFSLGAFDFLDCGDLTWNIEKQLVCHIDRIRFGRRNAEGAESIDLYQVTHHGMDISNHPTLVLTIKPTVAVMNNGPRKGGSPATVKLLKSLPSLQALYALHRNQATGPEDNADPALTANADPAGGQFIHVRVAPDGSSFTVRIGPDGEPRSFPCR